jgi:hypothetical protein
MDFSSGPDPFYSPIPGVIPGEIDVRRLPVTRDDEEQAAPTPVRPHHVEPPDNPQRIRPWRNRIAAAALLIVAIVSFVIAIFAS